MRKNLSDDNGENRKLLSGTSKHSHFEREVRKILFTMRCQHARRHQVHNIYLDKNLGKNLLILFNNTIKGFG